MSASQGQVDLPALLGAVCSWTELKPRLVISWTSVYLTRLPCQMLKKEDAVRSLEKSSKGFPVKNHDRQGEARRDRTRRVDLGWVSCFYTWHYYGVPHEVLLARISRGLEWSDRCFF